MLAPGNSYSKLYSEFKWDIPEFYNMGVDVCDKWAAEDPDKLAIIDLSKEVEERVSFGHLKAISDALAVELMHQGIHPGDRVGVLRSQDKWTAAAHIAIWKLGAISVPLFVLFGEDALSVRIKDSGTNLVITELEQADRLRKMSMNCVSMVPELIDIKRNNEKFQSLNSRSDDPALLIYTSGTTGPPKGALHAHRVLFGHLPGVEMSHDFLPVKGDCLWTPADWAWIGGLLDVLMPGLHHGVPVVASRLTKFTARDCIRIIKQASVRNVFFPPTALRMLRSEGAVIKGLRSIASGGEPLGEDMLKWAKSATGLTVNEFYGQTECNMVLSSCAALSQAKAGVTGVPVPGHEVQVINENGDLTQEEGDIAIKCGTPVMMLEYWNNPEATQQKFRKDWLITGDRGIREGDSIRFIARDDDIITTSGYRVGPAEIEDCLLSHPAIASVGVVGKPDTTRTEIVKAYVVLVREIEPSEQLVSELQAHVSGRLAKYEYPREIEFVNELPMTVTGKVKRKDLKARASSSIV